MTTSNTHRPELIMNEKDFVETYRSLFFEKATPEEGFYQQPIVYTCEAHRLKMVDDQKNKDRSSDAKELFE